MSRWRLRFGPVLLLAAALAAALGVADLGSTPSAATPRARWDGAALRADGLPLAWVRAATGAVRVFAVAPGESIEGLPPTEGTVRRRGRSLAFTPRYPWAGGAAYRMVIEPPVGESAEAVVLEARAPAPGRRTPRARVTALYPSADRLPANQLKLYIHFSHPMGGERPYDYLRLIDEATGEALENVFHEAATELWSRDRTRFTVLFDPGRLKRGLRNHELWGLPLTPGHRYRLEISSAWPDARGVPLVGSFEKRLVAGLADRERPAIGRWRLSVPAPGSRQPLRVTWHEPLDHALLLRALGVADVDGGVIEGSGEVGSDERSWSFTPESPWVSGAYRLVVDPRLEDMAGNNLERLFDLDRSAPQGTGISPPRTEREFRVGSRSAATEPAVSSNAL